MKKVYDVVHVIVLGGPGSGKGSQAENLKKFASVPTEIIVMSAELEQNATAEERDLMARGILLPDERAVELHTAAVNRVLGQIPKPRLIVHDGIARRHKQTAMMIKNLQSYDDHKIIVVEIDVPPDVCVNRIVKERSLISGRLDDKDPKTVRGRIETYQAHIADVARVIQSAGLSITIVHNDGTHSIEWTFNEMMGKVPELNCLMKKNRQYKRPGINVSPPVTHRYHGSSGTRVFA